MDGTGKEGDQQKLVLMYFQRNRIKNRFLEGRNRLLRGYSFSYWVLNSKDEKVQTGFYIPCMLMKRGCRTPDDIREDSSDRSSSISIWFCTLVYIFSFLRLKMIFCLFGVLIVKDVKIKHNICKHNVFWFWRKVIERRKRKFDDTKDIYFSSSRRSLAGVFASSCYEFKPANSCSSHLGHRESVSFFFLEDHRSCI